MASIPTVPSNDESWEDIHDDEDSLEEDDSVWKDLKEGWKQHFVAVLVALLATTFAYQRSQQFVVEDSQHPLHKLVNERHAHLSDYRRTANLTFCDDLAIRPSDELRLMDFNIPNRLLPALQAHYTADDLEDDDYSRANEFVSSEDEQFQCLLDKVATTQKSYVAGLTYYYPSPTVDSMYADRQAVSVKANPSRLTPVHLTFTGFAAKFVNLSPQPLLLYWDGVREGNDRLVGEIAPMESLGTATTPGQSFRITPVYDSSHALDRWVVTADEPVLYYEPELPADLSPTLRRQYDWQKLNQDFATHYLIHAKRPWLANFPRAFPVYPLWPATRFGETHTVGEFTLKVASVTPRVFEIDNFASATECEQLIALAQGNFHKSTVYSGASPLHEAQTRSSSNAWLARETAALTDQLYQRAAKVMQLDDALLRAPLDDGWDRADEHSVAESLQVVHYRVGEEYTAHHDFVYPKMTARHQPTRFATLLLYLNDDYEGGQTVFPRAANAQHHDGVRIEPSRGKAVLFYNVLPDGNVDDLSQHSSEPVTRGEKYLANLWVWEPHIY